jgi:enamine deaminase RidA (YjgF/YER057c/UK114 family)
MIKSTYILLLCFVLLSHCTIEQEALYSYDIEERIAELGIVLTPPSLPPGLNIEMANRSGNMIYLSGNGPIAADGTRTVGKVGAELTIEEGYQAARLTAINHLSILKEEIGDLNKVVKIVKVLGLVNAPVDFTEHPKVINGYTDLMLEVFGERGRHARSAMGMGSLPWNLACEIETVVEIRE